MFFQSFENLRSREPNMRHVSVALLVIMSLCVAEGHGCSTSDEFFLRKRLTKKDPANNLKTVDQADTYSARLSAMSDYNKDARKRGCNNLLTEQDHMPPKSTIIKAKTNALSKALFGKGPNDMLAMTYLKPYHRTCGTTGCLKGIQAIHNLITSAINAKDVLLTYKYSILATNTDEITSPRRDFNGYMQEYFDRLGDLVTKADKNHIKKWTNSVLKDEKKILKDINFEDLIDVFYAAEGIKLGE